MTEHKTDESGFDPQQRVDDFKKLEPEFWKHKSLEQLNDAEWEALCDGCGKCCLNKIEIKGKIKFTCVRCRFLDSKSCLCQIYEHRFEAMDDCRKIDISAVREKPRWLPKTCAYWLLDNGYPLPEWHPLITGRADSVKNAGMDLSCRQLINETKVKDYEDYIVDWQDL
ncbi:MAG: YcgN family cysteine cluster protein [Pseudomonadota bacterium]|nr:YcgN family cysteine cluster protein [Pseudomonadota bacterium]